MVLEWLSNAGGMFLHPLPSMGNRWTKMHTRAFPCNTTFFEIVCVLLCEDLCVSIKHRRPSSSCYAQSACVSHTPFVHSNLIKAFVYSLCMHSCASILCSESFHEHSKNESEGLCG